MACERVGRDRCCYANVDRGGGFVYTDGENCLTARLVLVTDLVPARRCLGRSPRSSDRKLTTLAIGQLLFDGHSERRSITLFHQRLRLREPYLLRQSGYRDCLPGLAPWIYLLTELHTRISPALCDLRPWPDSIPVACSSYRGTVTRSHLSRWPAHGYLVAHSRRFWDLRLCPLSASGETPVTVCLAQPWRGERDLATAIAANDRDRAMLASQETTNAGKGVTNADFRPLAVRLGARSLRRECKAE